MANRRICILQVNSSDLGGGAARITWGLFQAYRSLGYGSWLAVGYKQSEDPGVIAIDNDAFRTGWAQMWLRLGNLLLRTSVKAGARRTGRTADLISGYIGQPLRWLKVRRGYEDFDFPATHRLLYLAPEQPDILHCHNLHGGYFDLRSLPTLSKKLPVVLTLHDAWLLSGHCAHSFDCDRWQIGCGQCPDLTIYPAIRRDATAANWQRKRQIYSKSRIYVSTPSQWLMQKVEKSMLAPAVVEGRVIPYGLDLSIFRPGDKEEARSALGLPLGVKLLLFASNGILANAWKDFGTLRCAVAQTAEHLNEPVLFVALGDNAQAEQIGRAQIRFVGYQNKPEIVARYYQAADVYLHASRVDTFPNTILEAQACGIPVVATAVGGIPEQVKGLATSHRGLDSRLNRYGADSATGVLVPPADPELFSAGLELVVRDHTLSRRIGENGSENAKRFDLKRQIDDYLTWYEQLTAPQTVGTK